ncbi:AMP-binding enzyme [Streptomyces tagetis]|uniref:AMP-binding protein n=1 Tax=Streptomyces tagetis TaxID=2820809 RepID=A0A940XBI7_9ACTN|nr:AMP-binding protein [Streptomyces sp. RG38]MBQ0825076.1 AMP-binding protein [Streptomyces sp. RG38]
MSCTTGARDQGPGGDPRPDPGWAHVPGRARHGRPVDRLDAWGSGGRLRAVRRPGPPADLRPRPTFGRRGRLYGGTESIAITVITGEEWLERRGSAGRPWLGDMKVLNAEGDELPRGEIGEIYMKGADGLGPNYEYVGAESRSMNGWETLGDLGWMDEDGYLYISDRRVDMIVSGGANIYPAEVENAIDQHPKVLSTVVVGLPDDDLGQRVHAVVQAAPGTTAQEILDFLADRLVRYKIPRSIEFSEEPLRDDSGKVRRSRVRNDAIERMKSRA